MSLRITLLLLTLCITQARAFDKPDQDHILWVTKAQVEEYTQAMAHDPQAVDNSDFSQRMLDEIREHTLLALAYESRGVPLDSVALDRLAQDHEEIARRVLMRRRMQVPEVSENDLLDLAELSRYEYFVSHILVPYHSQAEELSGELQKGANFTLLARRHSKDPGSAELGGSLGMVRVGETVAEFEHTVLRLHPGEISPPVESPFGWHLIRLDSLRLVEDFPSKDKLEALQEHLEMQARQQAEKEVLRQARQENEVFVDEKLLRSGLRDPNAVVGSTRDTSITVGQLKKAVQSAFGGRVRELGDEIYFDYLRYWLDSQLWHRECLRQHIFEDEEVLDRVDIHERLLKSGLLVAQDLMPRVQYDEQDLWNYQNAHPAEFASFRHFGVWRFDFADSLQTAEARHEILRNNLSPEDAAARWQPGLHPAELRPDEAQAMGGSVYSDLVGLDAGRWSKVSVDAAGNCYLWCLVQRRLPMMEESELLTEAVETAVRQAMLAVEITRIVDEMTELSGLSEARLIKE